MKVKFNPPKERPYRFGLKHVLVGTLVSGAVVGILDGCNQFPGWLSGKSIWIAFAPMFVYVIRHVYRQTKSIPLQHEFLGLLQQDRLQEAWAMLDRIDADYGTAVPRPFFLNSRAAILISNGQFNEALVLLHECHADRELHQQRILAEIRKLVKYNLAICYALLGDLEKAEEWLEQTRAELSVLQDSKLILIEAVIAIRQGRADAAEKRIQEEWKAIEGMVTGAFIKRVRVLYAFALKLKGNEEYRDILAACRPTVSGEFDHLAVHWPELGAFLEENGLAEKSPTAVGG